MIGMERDEAILRDAESRVPRGWYEHYKGDTYFVDGYSLESTNGREREALILYKNPDTMLPNSRRLIEFIESIELDGVMRPRFRKV